MPEATDQEILNLLDTQTRDYTPFQPTTTPLTDQQVQESLRKTELQTTRPLQVTPNLNKPETPPGFVEQNQIPGVPLQLRGPGPLQMNFGPLYRFEVGRRRLMSDKQAYLESQFGQGNVRTTKDGNDFIIRVNDPETGTPKDVLFNEKEITFGDIAALAGAAPEAVAGLLAMKAGRGIPKVGAYTKSLGFLRDVVLGAAGAEAGGALSDIEARAQTGQPIDIPEIAQARARQIPVDVTAGYLTAGALKGAVGTVNLVSNPLAWAHTESQKAAAAAIENIQNKTGIRLAQTPGEASGWPFLIQGEQYLRAHPASAAKMAQQDALVSERLSALSEYMTSGAGTDEEAANALKFALQAQRDAIEGTVAGAAGQVRTEATQAIQNELSKIGPTAQPSPIATGAAIRQGILGQRQGILATSRQNYADVYALPEASQPIVPTKPIADTLKSIEENLPTRTVTKETPTGVLGPTGEPYTTTTTTTEPLQPYVPDPLKRFLQGDFDPNMRLNQVVEMRNLLYSKIAAGEPVEGIPTRYLKEVGHSMTEAIDQGISDLPTSELKDRLVKANDFYKTKVVPLAEPGIGDVVASATEPGFIENSSILKRIQNQPDIYKRTMEFVGADSPTGKAINRGITDQIMRESSIDGTMQTVDGNTLFKNLMDLKKSNPDTFNSVFGPNIGKFVQSAKALAAASGEPEFKLSMQDALSFFDPGNKSPTLKALHDLAQAQRNREVDLSNSILREYTNSNFDPSKIVPNDFVGAFLDRAKPSEVRDVINRVRDLDPEIAQQIGRKTIEKLLGESDMVGSKLESLMVSDKYAGKLEDIIGPSGIDTLNSLTAFLKNKERAQKVAGGTGILTKGSAIGSLFRVVPGFAELSDLAKRKIGAYIISSPALRAMATADFTPTEIKDLGAAVVTSVPFLKAAAEDFGQDVPGLTAFMKAAKRAAIPLGGGPVAPTHPPTTPASDQQILQLLNQR